MPLHRRLQDDVAARIAIGPLSQWGVVLESSSDGHVLSPMAPSIHTLAGLVLGVVFVAIVGYEHAGQFLTKLSRGEPDATLLAVPAAVLFVILLARGIRETFFPPVLRITPHGVSYGFKKMGFNEIEGVMATSPARDRRQSKQHHAQ